MLGAIGETFDPSLSGSSEPTSPSAPKPPKSLITGVIVSARPQFYRISIWTRLAPQSTPSPVTNSAPLHPEDEGEPLRVRIESIGKHFKTKVLSFSESSKLAGPLATEVEFTSHKDSEKKGKTVKKWIV
jgi:translation initiation factor 4E